LKASALAGAFSGEVVHYQKVVVALREAIRLMGAVEAVIESAGGWLMK